MAVRVVPDKFDKQHYGIALVDELPVVKIHTHFLRSSQLHAVLAARHMEVEWLPSYA